MLLSIFDFTPLTRLHLILAGVGFLLVYLSLSILLKRPKRYLRPVKSRRGVYYAGFILVAVMVLLTFANIDGLSLRFGLLAAAFVTLLIGFYDEEYSLSPQSQLIWQLIIAAIVVLWGWRITYISHPSTFGIIRLDQFVFGPLIWPGSFLTIAWLLLLMNSINWLDGIDGLAIAVSTIALFTLSLLTLLPSLQDARTLTISLLGSGAALGFLVWNFPPARVFLGTSGSWFLGLFIGIVAILTGGKIVTTLLVLAIPVIDLFIVVIMRLLSGRLPWIGDRTSHLHYRLTKAGVSPRAIVLSAIFVTIALGFGALTLQTTQKIIAFIAALIMFSLISIELLWHARK